MYRWLTLLLVWIALAGCSPSTNELAPELEELLALVNATRSQGYACASGYMPPVAPLTDDARLNRAAQMHAEDMDAAGQLSHETPAGAIHFAPGTTPGERMLSTGFPVKTWGENLATGTSPEEVLAVWLASTEGHCEGLMRAAFTHAGVGRSGAYWTLDMASAAER